MTNTDNTGAEMTAATADRVPTYGYCPTCGAQGVERERTLRNGRTTCAAGHVYLSKLSVYPAAK